MPSITCILSYGSILYVTRLGLLEYSENAGVFYAFNMLSHLFYNNQFIDCIFLNTEYTLLALCLNEVRYEIFLQETHTLIETS